SPPLALVALLALYWSRQVCMRALPSVSFEYFGATAVGNTALPAGADAVVAFGVSAGFAAGFAGAAGVGAAVVGAGAAVGVAAASALHSALRKSFHFSLLPAACAALYFALHSCIVRAWLGTTVAIVAALKIAEAATANTTGFNTVSSFIRFKRPQPRSF